MTVKAQRTVLFASKTVAEFNAWGKAISESLAEVGLVKTSDTGQVNWSTNSTLPPAATPVREFWRFTDALQASHPVFVGIQYGVGGTGDPAVVITVGTGTTGSGALINPGVARRSSFMANASTNPSPLVVSSDGSYLTIMAGVPLLNVTAQRRIFFIVVVDRSRDNANKATKDAVFFGFVGHTSQPSYGPNYNSPSPAPAIFYQTLSSTHGWSTPATGWPVVGGDASYPSRITDTTISASPVLFSAPQLLWSSASAGVITTDAGPGLEITTEVNGQQITYRTCGTEVNSVNSLNSASVYSDSNIGTQNGIVSGLVVRVG